MDLDPPAGQASRPPNRLPAPAPAPASFAALPFELQAHILDCLWATVDGPASEKGVQPIEAEVFECFGSLALVSRRMSELVAPHLWKVSPGLTGGSARAREGESAGSGWGARRVAGRRRWQRGVGCPVIRLARKWGRC